MINDIEKYKFIVHNYCNRIITEKRMSIDVKYENGKSFYSIKFYQPEWFTELDDNMQENIILSLQNHYSLYVTNLINNQLQENCSRKRKFTELSNNMDVVHDTI